MIACVDLPAFPLQLVWREEPAWHALPVVIVDEDRPQGVILWACERARAARILPGMRYGHALGLARDLRARVKPAVRLAEATAEITAVLRTLSPSVEAADAEGTFWLDGAGLERLWTPERWAAAIAAAVGKLALRARVVVGFTRFGTYAIAKAAREPITVLPSDPDERTRAREVPLARLDIDPHLRDALARLAVHTVGELVRLPGGGVLERFGHEAHRLYQIAAGQLAAGQLAAGQLAAGQLAAGQLAAGQLASGERWDPLVPEPPPDAPDERTLLDEPERDTERLIFAIKAALDRLLARLAATHRALAMLHLELTLQRGVRANQVIAERVAHAIRPAQPTLDARALVRLVHLRLEGAPPDVGVIVVRVWADDVAATREQLSLFATKPRRDLRAADEALARLRAELGDDAVVKAVLRDGHLPEARFGWERIDHVVPARVSRSEPRLVRRIVARPVALPPASPHLRDDGWLVAGIESGAVVRAQGPYIISGGWWAGAEVHRDYHFVETRRGAWLWIYFDRARRRWFRHGAIE